MVDLARTRFPDDMSAAARPSGGLQFEDYAERAVEQVKDYARENPVAFAAWAFGIGFVLGWKLKPW